ncbi:uncharacterized protein LOC101848438 [Aplysia californica]|uniref:Uncharacterized protein LOC101848438 n=1 Tax=Aplysia californica TaxID=6500 RepID=A0ABM0JSX5_APLCA|nr:uncharacterized protein LOC101848438 [Aplysia californica]
MGTLYECLREARLEQFYPAFRANGITRSEALINLGMPEFCALGITASEDKRRLIELVNIIKSVHSSGLSDSPIFPRRNINPQHHHPNHNTPSSSSPSSTNNAPTTAQADTNQGFSSGRGTSHNPNRNRNQSLNRGNSFAEQSSPGTQRFGASRDVSVRDRVPNFSAASYLDMLQFMSESSDETEDEGDEESGEEEEAVVMGGAAAVLHPRNVTSPSAVRASTSRGPVERIKHSQEKSYNYGVHKLGSPSKVSKSSRGGSGRHLGDEKIKVCVRKRPLTRREQRGKEDDVVTVESTNTLIVNEPKLAVDLKAYTLQHEFVFDEVFDESCSNEDVYIRAARPLISCIFNGGTATCFAYGQTGAGKTHTMLGNENVPGLYLLAGQDIFSIIQSEKYGSELHVWVSFFEIYCGQLFDLLNRRNRLHAREDGSRQVCIAGLTETEATSVTSLVQTLEYGNSVRSKGATGVNPDSSRSHAILQLDIRNSDDIKVGKISFIDLAGSERASDVTDTDKQTRLEGAEINQSLLALKECIRSIDQDSRHTPFRQSKLTHILKDSFIGNSRTCMIANISPTQTACENTLNTLRYADRVKELKRDSVRGSSTVGQAMNLLMNIPPTAPTIFHPSNILSSSTPMRQSTQSRRERLNEPSEIDLDPSETPIRGHNMPRRSNFAKDNSRSNRNNTVGQSQQASTKVRSDQPSAAASVLKPVPSSAPSRSRSVDTAASQGSVVPPPDASPSESDHTDTDSCNVTNPTYTLTSRPRGRQLPVAQSTDTEFDFPTSDFNNVDDFNDLNRTDPNKVGEQLAESRKTQNKTALPSAATAENVAVTSSFSVVQPPVTKPVVYTSSDTQASSVKISGTLAGNVKTSAGKPAVPEVTQRFQSADVTPPLQSKQNPSFKKAFMKEVVSSDDSVDDEEMFADGPLSEGRGTNTPTKPASNLSHVLSTTAALMRPQLMVPQPAESSDLTKFTQRQTLNAPGTNDLSGKHTVGHKLLTDQAVGIDRHKSTPGSQPSVRSKSPGVKTKPQGGRPLPSPPLHASGQQNQAALTVSDISPPSQQQPQTKGKSSPSPSQDLKGIFDSPSSHEKSDIVASPQATSIHSDSGSQSPKVRRHSDDSDSKRRRRRGSHSPTGEVSDDSTDSIRASLSDQGQGGYRKTDSVKGRMRKERSDPILALNMQRKKHTLPDPENITKMLTRSNTPKSGLTQGTSGWKVIHSELPTHHRARGHPQEVVEEVECHSEPGSLAAAANIGPEDQASVGVAGHLSDDGYGGLVGKQSSVRTVRDNSPLVSLGTKAKQLPQTPLTAVGGDKNYAASAYTQKFEGIQEDNEEYRKPEINIRINPAIVTEKLASGSVFSPIHPQPVTSVGTKMVVEPSVASSLLLQPTPVTATTLSGVSCVADSVSRDGSAINELQEARMHLVSAHEDQLATITSLCKYEMRLLLNAKKVSGKKGFDDYLRRVSDILHQKMSAIASLQDQISQFRCNNSVSQSSSVTSSVQMSVSESHSSVSTQNNLTSK